MHDDLFDIASDDEIVLRVHVHPGAGRTLIVGRHGDALKVRIGAPPTGGRANDAAAEVVAEIFGVKADAVTLSAGQTSRDKRFRVKGLELDEVRRLLDLALEEAARTPGGGGR